ncbi:hypothetical protein [Streptomyces pratensis]|uniref:hypothetical protein n=1 Tax=Streptomyces pratensis TaxID=1169025 RepID=UPI0036288CDE
MEKEARPGNDVPGPREPQDGNEGAGARRPVELVLDPAQGMAPELAGPRVEQLVDLVRRLIRGRHERGLVVPVRLPGTAGAAMAGDGRLPAGPGPRGIQTFDDWLAREM